MTVKKQSIWQKLFSPTKKRKYEGSQYGKRFTRWRTPGTDANRAIAVSLSTLRNRARDLRRNNPYAAKAIQVTTSNVVGKGVKTQIKGEQAISGQDGPIEQMFKQWALTPMCDYEGRHDLLTMQRLIMDAVQESGEVLVRKRFNASNPVPLQYQILESDFLDTSKLDGETSRGTLIIQGVELDKQGRRLGYHLYESHPGGFDASFAPSAKSNFIPADEIYHIYRTERPGQVRGVPWSSPVIVRLKDLDDFEDAQLVRQKVAACFSAFVRDISADAIDDEDCSDLGQKIEPGLIEFLPPGKTVDFADPPTVENYKEYTSALLHAIAAGYGITYESLTGDLSEVNFSSARMGWLEFQRNLETWRKEILINHFLDPVLRDFMSTMEIMGMRTNGLSWVHTPPRREMIDPTKEVPAAIKAVRAGFSTLSDEILSQGKDPAEQFSQLQQDNENLDDLGLILDSDPRKIGLNGRAQDAIGGEDDQAEG